MGPARSTAPRHAAGLERGVDGGERAAHAVAEQRELRGAGGAQRAAHHAVEPRQRVIPGAVAIFVLGGAPVEAPHVEAGVDQRRHQAGAGAQVEHVPLVDERRHQQHRAAAARASADEAVERRGALAGDHVARRGHERRRRPHHGGSGGVGERVARDGGQVADQTLGDGVEAHRLFTPSGRTRRRCAGRPRPRACATRPTAGPSS
jgi:hypothetical protein